MPLFTFTTLPVPGAGAYTDVFFSFFLLFLSLFYSELFQALTQMNTY